MISWNSQIRPFLASMSTTIVHADANAKIGTDAYIVPVNRGQDLLVSLPVIIHRDLTAESSLPPAAASGAVQKIIEIIKKKSREMKSLGPIRGAGTANEAQYEAHVEPCTIAGSPSRMGSALWHAGDQNRIVPEGIRLELHAAFSARNEPGLSTMESHLSTLAEAVADLVLSLPLKILEKEWENVALQQALRSWMDESGYVCFIGDGTKPAREYTRYRAWYRIAGPKKGVHIPFISPPDLEPVTCTVNAETITGLAIKKNEIFSITGANAQGKSSLIQAILSGEDDHMLGDGRERLVTTPGAVSVDATSIDLRGADVSRFFRTLPPGMGGGPASATGQGSGSLSMAAKIQEAMRKKTPLIVIDEDKAAMNLLVPWYPGTEDVIPLSSLCRERNRISGTTLIFAGSGMEQLVACSDRVLRLSDHQASAVPLDEYRRGLVGFYQRMIRELSPVDQRSTHPGDQEERE